MLSTSALIILSACFLLSTLLGFFVRKIYVQRIRQLETLLEAGNKEKAQLIQTEKYAFLRELSAGVSHEINNPLAIILGRVQALNMKLRRQHLSVEDVCEQLNKIEHNVQRISKIVRSLHMMTKDSTFDESENIPVISLFEDLSSFWCERLKNKGYNFDFSRVDPSLEIHGQRSLLITALFNIVSNSFEATQDLTEKWILMHTSVKSGRLELSIIDSGKGIPSITQNRIFDPFFTTRMDMKSIGLGLSVTKSIIDIHQGSIEYDAMSENTRFVIQLPLVHKNSILAA